MAEKVGGIEYEVGMDVQGTLTGTTKLNKTLDGLEKRAKQADKTIDKFNKTTKQTTKGMGDFGRKAGMAGVQFEQLIGSINAGQNPMRAFGFQATDLGYVLGFPLVGAVVGIAASIGSTLIPALLGGGNAVEDFKFDVNELTEELKELEKLSKAQAKVAARELNKSMGELSKQAEETGKKIAKLNKDIDNNAKFTNNGRRRVKLSKEEREKLVIALEKEQANLDTINQKYKTQSDALTELTSRTKGIVDGTKEFNDKITDLESSLRGQIIALNDGEEAAFRYATAQGLGLKAIEKLPPEIDKAITKIFELKAAQEKADKKKKDDNAAVQREQQIIDKLDQQIAQRQMTKTEYQEFLLMQQLGIENEGQMTDAVRTRLELLRTLNAEQGTFSEGFLEQMEALRESADNVGHSLGKAFGGNVTSAVDNLSSGIADAVMNQESLGDAVKETARAFVRDMIASLVKVAAQRAINFAIEQTMGVAATTASATMAGTLAAAWAPAAAFASLAMAGTNAAPAAVGIASTVGLSQGLAIAGGKFNGGHVAGGSMYRVGENNKPELLQSGNEQYLIPGSNGKVISNNEMTGSGGAIQVTVNNYGEPAEVKVQQNGNFVTIDMLPSAVTGIMQNDFANRGKARKTLENTSNLSNRTA